MNGRLGFMQGRLSPLIDGRVQSFPWSCWREEFPLAERHGFRLMEWTLDQDKLYENPLLTLRGQAEIRALCKRHRLAIPSLTADCFMQAPYWKASGAEREKRQRDFRKVTEACALVGIRIIVVPLVDNGRVENPGQEDVLVAIARDQIQFLLEHDLRLAFESDYGPADLARFISRLEADRFGINYDIGNSAALGFEPAEEVAAYGKRIINVHVKDRMLGGTTVPLGAGDADFETVFAALGRLGYVGNYILQTARAFDGDHAGVLCRYRDMTVDWLTRHAA